MAQHWWVRGVPLTEGFLGDYRFELDVQGALVIAQVHLYPKVKANPIPRGGITARVLRQVAVTPIQRVAEELTYLGDLSHDFKDGPLRLTPENKNTLTKKHQPRRYRSRDERLATIANEYVEAVVKTKTGRPRPIPIMAKRHNLEEITISGYVNEARKKGFLTESPPGKAGGSLTKKARTILQRMETRKGK